MLRVYLADIDTTPMFLDSKAEEQAAMIRLSRQLRQLTLDGGQK